MLLDSNALSGGLDPGLFGQLREVAQLDLSHNQFVGEVPAAVGNMTMLTEFQARGNALTGPLPASLEESKRLKTLDLSRNRLSGPVPDFLVSLDRLAHLDLSLNQFYGHLPGAFWDAQAERVRALPALRSDEQEAERKINLGGNPFWCPLPDWAASVHATCRYPEVFSVHPSQGSVAGGDVVRLKGTGFPPLDRLGCLFGTSDGGEVWVEAGLEADGSVAGISPSAPAAGKAIVRLGFDGHPLSHFGEKFLYVHSDSEM